MDAVNADDEAWERRRLKRQLLLDKVKAMPQYQAALESQRAMPPEPVPSDRSLSKRAWEKLHLAFRAAIREM